ncbi:MAG: cache domain-containing protein [Rhodobacteraceae bacterium]|nr:cache domain-containing protein [Paracoccaceae bacterium]
MLVLLPLLLGGTMLRWSGKIDKILISKVNGDLTIANQYLARLMDMSGERLDAVAGSVALQQALGQKSALEALLAERRVALQLDFLYLATEETRPGGFQPDAWPVVRAAWNGSAESAIDILSAEALDQLSPGLADQAAIHLVPTVAAVATARQVEDRGMIIHSAAPVHLPDGRRAALVGGQLLNRNLDFIDTINALVYREQSLPKGSRGTATLFLEDVRVSTNVRLFENVRALGTRVSAVVRARVLDEGAVWLDRAFVVNDWYISAYEPIVDSFGTRVGMLYVGYLETPFQHAKTVSILTIILMFLLIATISVPIFLRWAGRIFLPLERMTQTIARVEAGDLQARNGDVDDSGEIAQVAAHFDDLLDQIQERDRLLRDWANSLEQKVEERTADLRTANRKLEKTTERLIISEKLAAVGEITASVAHEINNPIAVIQGNVEVARSLLAEHAEAVETEFRLIDDQIYRIGSIVSKLLHFARPEDYSGAATVISPAEVVRDCLVLTRHQIATNGIVVEIDMASDKNVLMARTELQQVLVNLILNAVHAMPEGGTLSLAVRDVTKGVKIEVADSGTGIAPETLRRIFDPFFTTKQAQGTGLGLSISQTLVRHAGGTLTASSVPGEGSLFTIFLPQTDPQ